MPLALQRRFSSLEYERLKLGLIPEDMDDRWFIYFHGPDQRLIFHRSWTGFCIFVIQLEEEEDGDCRIAHASANADPEQFRCSDPAEAARLLSALLDRQLASV